MRSARLLSERGASTDAVAAHLLSTEPAGDQWVVDQLRHAAAGGMALSAPETMGAYLERAVAEPPPPAERAGLLLFLGGARIQNGEGTAIEPLFEALAIGTEPSLRMEAARQLSGALFLERRYEEALGILHRSIAELRATDEGLALRLEMSLIHTLYIDLPGLEDRLERLDAAPADPSGAEPIDRIVLARRAWVAMHRDESPELALARAALGSGTLLDDDAFGVSFEMALWPLIAAERYDEALGHADAAVEGLRARGWLRRAGCILPWRSEIHRRCGRLELAAEDARVATETVEPTMLMFPLGVRARVEALVDRGEVEPATVALAEHGFESEIPAGGLFDGLWLARGRLRLLRNQVRAGLEDILEYGRICERLERGNPAWAPWRSLASRAHLQLGERAEALALAADEVERAQRVGTPVALGIALRALGLVLGGAEGRARLEDAAETLAATPAVLEHAAALCDLGALVRREGQREAARDPLRRALEIAERAGAAPLADRSRDELLATGARPRRAALSGVDSLTPSERRVVDLAGESLTNREIAQALFITVKTVENHLRNSYAKLGIAGKRELPAVLAGAP
jgi:DNA-binding CsgD family transcriptional regulator